VWQKICLVICLRLLYKLFGQRDKKFVQFFTWALDKIKDFKVRQTGKDVTKANYIEKDLQKNVT